MLFSGSGEQAKNRVHDVFQNDTKHALVLQYLKKSVNSGVCTICGLECILFPPEAYHRHREVANGGKLAHIPADFYTTQFFFCNDMSDPLVNKLLSRSLVVRDAAWIPFCVQEGFPMPLGPYTLDDAFAGPHAGSAEIARAPRPAGKASADRPRSDSETYTQGGLPSAASRTRKRAVDEESEGLHALQRPLKKAKVHEAPVLRKTSCLKTGVYGTPPRISFPTARIENGKACKPIMQFARLVDCQDTTEAAPGTTHRVNRHSEELQHGQFWTDMVLAQRSPQQGSTALVLSVDDILRGPGPANAAIFDVNETYLGRRFVNLQSTKRKV